MAQERRPFWPVRPSLQATQVHEPSGYFLKSRHSLLAAALVTLAACPASHAQTEALAFESAAAASPEPEQPRTIEIVRIPEPLPLPGQLKSIETSAAPETDNPKLRIGKANAAARMQPVRDGFLNAIQQYPWSEGALYQLHATPGQVTDIALQDGEQLVGPDPVAAGDTVRRIIGDTVSGTGPAQRVHILVKPTRPGLTTNLVINTDRRTYHLELRATPDTYMASEENGADRYEMPAFGPTAPSQLLAT